MICTTVTDKMTDLLASTPLWNPCIYVIKASFQFHWSATSTRAKPLNDKECLFSASIFPVNNVWTKVIGCQNLKHMSSRPWRENLRHVTHILTCKYRVRMWRRNNVLIPTSQLILYQTWSQQGWNRERHLDLVRFHVRQEPIRQAECRKNKDWVTPVFPPFVMTVWTRSVFVIRKCRKHYCHVKKHAHLRLAEKKAERTWSLEIWSLVGNLKTSQLGMKVFFLVVFIFAK